MFLLPSIDRALLHVMFDVLLAPVFCLHNIHGRPRQGCARCKQLVTGVANCPSIKIKIATTLVIPSTHSLHYSVFGVTSVDLLSITILFPFVLLSIVPSLDI